MSKEITILNKTIAAGESAIIKMDLAKLHTHTKVEVPIIVERGKKDGPCILLVSGIHGDEVNGVEIVRQIVAKGYNKPECGTVICIPLLNVFGFLIQTREFPDGRDLNRVFPGSKDGSLASIFAYHLMKEVVPNVDYCIDYHTGGAQRFNYTHIRLNNDDESLKLANIFGAKFIMVSKNREKSFRDSMVKMGKKVLLFEGGKSLYLDKLVTKTGIQGAINVMHELGIRDFSTLLENDSTKTTPIILNGSKWIRANHSGMFRRSVHVGQEINKNEQMGSISDPFGEFEWFIKSPQSGYVLSSNHSPIVNKGDALFHIGYV